MGQAVCPHSCNRLMGIHIVFIVEALLGEWALQDAATEQAWLRENGQLKTRGLLLNFGAVGNTKDYVPI